MLALRQRALSDVGLAAGNVARFVPSTAAVFRQPGSPLSIW